MSKHNKKKNNRKSTFLDKIKNNKKIAGVAGVVLVALVVVLLLTIGGNRNPIFGEYKIGKLLYITPLSSQTTESYEEDYLGVTVSKKEFIVHLAEAEIEVEKPKYQTEEATEDGVAALSAGLVGETAAGLFEGAEKVHYIYDADGKQENYLLLEKADVMYFVRFYMLGDKLHIWHVFEITQ